MDKRILFSPIYILLFIFILNGCSKDNPKIEHTKLFFYDASIAYQNGDYDKAVKYFGDSAKPNAGLPHRVKTDQEKSGDVVYDVSPQVMGEYALKFKDLGVKIFGGCCGSTPDHIQAIAQALKP